MRKMAWGRFGNVAVAFLGVFFSGLWVGLMIADSSRPWHSYIQFLLFGGLVGVAVFCFVIVPSYLKEKHPISMG